MQRLISLFLFFTCSISSIHSQELPPLLGFSAKDYNAENQNWSVSQGSNKNMFFANNKGLLSFNGSTWQLYNSPNNTILRSVHAVDDIVYTGSYMDFGYWLYDKTGTLYYQSLVDELKVNLVEDEQFWNILSVTNTIIFQSLNRIYIYDTLTKRIDIIESVSTLTKMFQVNDEIYFQDYGHGIYKVENGTAVVVDDSSLARQEVIVNIFQSSGDLLYQTQGAGFHRVNSEGNHQKWNAAVNKILENVTVYNSIALTTGGYAVGTIAHGVYVISSEGEVEYHLDYSKGLENNTVLNLFQDQDGNVWLALDNGINCINLASAFRIYNDPKGLLGSVYASAIHQNRLYLGTNQGLFYKDLASDSEYSFVSNTNGQVWFLDVIDGTLFCGHNKGTFTVDGANARLLENGPEGTWMLTSVPNREDMLLQGNYSGLHVIIKEGNTWIYKNKIKGFDISSRHIAFESAQRIFVNHEYKGIYELAVDSDFLYIEGIRQDTLRKGLNSDLIRYKSDVLYSYQKGIYTYDLVKNHFVKDSTLSKLRDESQYVSGKLIYENDQERLWAFTQDAIHYVSPGVVKNRMVLSSIYLAENLRNTVSSYESILELEENVYLVGTSFGYITVDILKYKPIQVDLFLDAVEVGRKKEIRDKVELTGDIFFENGTDLIRFQLATPTYEKFFSPSYRYKLSGLYDEWSEWTNSNQIDFENLPYGDYTFTGQIKSSNPDSNNEIKYSFYVKEPWYLSNSVIVSYVLLFLLIIFLVNMAYKKYYRNKQERMILASTKESEQKRLQAQQELVRIENERLQQDIENRNKELATSTMNILRKNEILVEIKNALNKSKEVNIPLVIELIDRNLSNTGDWELFQEAFNNADKDFIKEMKERHPSLTANDLRLSAYLRLNLSSKEIAPLLNISSRSVEVKRYRLRKKLNLTQKSSLSDYILSI
ncbi:triple tyrosine motif-containing protein [Gangjinia marincola]|uniref:Triple tyrosine motif-containing protein n=1 Tax=Gangjinia marincola TaxID=578463 RepID=A0ABP3XSG1_9FLAO